MSRPARRRAEQIRKTQKKKELGLYLNNNRIPFSYHNINNYVITAIRGIGKSVISVETVIKLKRKYGYENVKAYYFRLTDLSVKAMLADKAKKAIDPILIDRYKLDITVKNGIVYDHGKPLIEFYPLVSAGSKGKGAAHYDANFLNNRPIGKNGKPIKRFVVTIWDEFLMAEGIEKKSIGDPVGQYKVYYEAIMRDQQRLDYDAVYCFYLANSVSECASVTGPLFNYIPAPDNYKILKLTRKHTIFWNVPVSEAYKEKRKNSYSADIMDYKNDINYTNKVQRDMELIIPKRRRLCKVTMLIKFTKEPTNWFCVYDGGIIRKYRGETVNKNIIVPMRRYLDNNFNNELVLDIFERYDNRGWYFADIISQALFTTQMKLLKAK